MRHSKRSRQTAHKQTRKSNFRMIFFSSSSDQVMVGSNTCLHSYCASSYFAVQRSATWGSRNGFLSGSGSSSSEPELCLLSYVTSVSLLAMLCSLDVALPDWPSESWTASESPMMSIMFCFPIGYKRGCNQAGTSTWYSCNTEDILSALQGILIYTLSTDRVEETLSKMRLDEGMVQYPLLGIVVANNQVDIRKANHAI